MRIDIEDVHRICNELKSINELDLKDIKLYVNNKHIDIPFEALENFKFTGLNNYYFFLNEFWKGNDNE